MVEIDMEYEISEVKFFKISGKTHIRLEKGDNRYARIRVLDGLMKGKVYDSDNYISALNHLRLDLEKAGVFLACNGSLRNFHASSMSIDMSDGLVGYQLEIGKKGSRKNTLKTFEMDGDYSDLATIAEQKNYYQKWRNSILDV